MVNKHCFINGCTTSKGQGFFHANEQVLEQWKKVIGKKGFTKSSRVCFRHFYEQDIIKGAILLNEFHPFKQWKLKKEAVPALHLDQQKEPLRKPLQPLNKSARKVNQGSKLVKNDNLVLTPSHSPGSHHTLELNENEEIFPDKIDNSVSTTMAELDGISEQLVEGEGQSAQNNSEHLITGYSVDDMQEVALLAPSTDLTHQGSHPIDILKKYVRIPSQYYWSWSVNKDTIHSYCSRHEIIDGNLVVRTAVFNDTRHLTFFINGKQVPESVLQTSYSSFEEIANILENFDALHECQGVADSNLLEASNVKSRLPTQAQSTGPNGIRARNCAGFSKDGICKICRIFVHNLKSRCGQKKKKPSTTSR